MKNPSVMFVAPWQAELQGVEMSKDLGPGQLLVKKQYSLISTGTELACLSGKETWYPMPSVSGYCCVSEVIESKSPIYQVGALVFHYGAHSLYQVMNDIDFAVPVAQKKDLHLVPFMRMATIAFTAIRVSDIELGDWVAVSGLGLVGNMAAQLAELSGGQVIGIDPSPTRREKAKECGAEYVLPPEGAVEKIREITASEAGVHTLIEATGIPQVAYDMLPAVGYHGEIVFLGTPRGETQGNLADVFCYSHLDERGCVTFKGAHEWRYPVGKNKFVKHSFQRNTEIALRLIAQGKLRVDNLASHIILPEQAGETYLAIAKNRDDYLGVVIDWTKT